VLSTSIRTVRLKRDPFIGSRLRRLQLCRRILGVLAQRLCKRICIQCKRPITRRNRNTTNLCRVWRTGLAHTRHRVSPLGVCTWTRLRVCNRTGFKGGFLTRTVKRIGRDEATYPIQSQDADMLSLALKEGCRPWCKTGYKSPARRDHLSAVRVVAMK